MEGGKVRDLSGRVLEGLDSLEGRREGRREGGREGGREGRKDAYLVRDLSGRVVEGLDLLELLPAGCGGCGQSSLHVGHDQRHAA